jgi:hypothetical protein
MYIFDRREDDYKITEFAFNEIGDMSIRTIDKKSRNTTAWQRCT